MSDELGRIANALERIADFYEKGLHVDIDHAHIDDIGEIHGDVTTHPKNFYEDEKSINSNNGSINASAFYGISIFY